MAINGQDDAGNLLLFEGNPNQKSLCNENNKLYEEVYQYAANHNKGWQVKIQLNKNSGIQ